jgi:hypothetical protein
VSDLAVVAWQGERGGFVIGYERKHQRMGIERWDFAGFYWSATILLDTPVRLDTLEKDGTWWIQRYGPDRALAIRFDALPRVRTLNTAADAIHAAMELQDIAEDVEKTRKALVQRILNGEEKE